MIDIILLLVLIPVIGIFFASLGLFFKSKLLRIAIPVVALILLLSEVACSVYFLQNLKSLADPFTNTLGADWFSSVLTIIIAVFCLIIGFYSISYFDSAKYFRFFTLFFSLNLGLILTVLARHLFILFLGWELLVISGYILVVFNQTKKAYEAGLKYLVISSFGSLEFLFGLGLLSGVVPSFYYDKLELVQTIMDTLVGKFALAFIVMGLGVTAGIVILNQWLPDAHPEAPAPVSALLSGILVMMGVYALFRVFSLLAPSVSYNSSVSYLMLAIGIATMFEGNIMVFAQFLRKEFIDFKRILAYSTTVHLGFLIILVPIQSTSYALSLHILNHGLAKILLFLISGSLIHVFSTRDLRKLQGVGSKNKTLGLSLSIALLSLAGFPGTGGFISKLTVLLTFYSIQGDYMILSLILILLNTALAFVGYLWIIKKIVFDKSPENSEKFSLGWIENSTFVLITLLILALGIYPSITWIY